MMRLALALALCAGLGCGPPKPKLVDFGDAPRGYRGLDYPEVYRRWTRHVKVVREMDQVIEAWGTLKSWEFREAWLERYCDLYNVPEADRAALRASQAELARKGYEIHLTAQSGRFEWNDLEKPSSAWKLTLVDALGREVLPEQIRIDRLPDAYVEEFFPDRTPFSRTYALRFPRAAGELPRRLTLRLANPLGSADMVWQSE